MSIGSDVPAPRKNLWQRFSENASQIVQKRGLQMSSAIFLMSNGWLLHKGFFEDGSNPNQAIVAPLLFTAANVVGLAFGKHKKTERMTNTISTFGIGFLTAGALGIGGGDPMWTNTVISAGGTIVFARGSYLKPLVQPALNGVANGAKFLFGGLFPKKDTPSPEKKSSLTNDLFQTAMAQALFNGVKVATTFIDGRPELAGPFTGWALASCVKAMRAFMNAKDDLTQKTDPTQSLGSVSAQNRL